MRGVPLPRQPIARQDIKKWFEERQLDKQTLKEILTQYFLSAASGAGDPTTSAPRGAGEASGSGGPAPAASAVGGAGVFEGMVAGASAFGGARSNIVTGIDLSRNSKGEYYIERGAPTDTKMIQYIWGGEDTRSGMEARQAGPPQCGRLSRRHCKGHISGCPLRYRVRNDGHDGRETLARWVGDCPEETYEVQGV